MRISSLVSAVAVFAAAGATFRADAQQPITVICGNGTSQTAGVYFDSLGRLVFSEPNVCGSTVIGVGMPDPLSLVITSPAASNPPFTVDVSNGSQQVSFAGNVGSSFDPDYDSCALSVNPLPNSNWTNPSPLTVGGTGAVSSNVTFDQGLIAGDYDLSLNCSRVINQQQVVVPSATRTVRVASNGGGNACAGQVIPTQFSPLNIAEFHSSYGVQFGQAFPQIGFPMTNVVSGGALQSAQVRSWRFTAPTSGVGQLFVDANAGTGFTLSISKGCPALFSPSEGVPSICTHAGTNSALSWRISNTPATNPSSRCELDPGETYYLNVVYIRRNDLNASPRVFANGCTKENNVCTFTFNRGQAN